jgi:hypothetical protein
MSKSAFFGTCLLVASSQVGAYDTGTLTCERIGELAATTLAAKQSGTAAGASLAALTDQFAADARVERKLVSNINNMIYQNDLIVAMKPGDAYMVFMRDCMNGRDWDRTR